MAEKHLRRNLAVLPIGTVMKLTGQTARQIRYYEAQALVFPERTTGHQRLFSLNDVDRLLEIKDYLAEGTTMAQIRQIYQKKADRQRDKQLSDEKARRLLANELLSVGGLVGQQSTISQSSKLY
ncbi:MULTISPECIES: MerR family transcriptional regulator [Latilactobacillus]|jgi:MerR family glutamine synthetase transcriptional repressor|uniref:MerR family transcriptional regulator n=2 Tax=Latilactobacillus curvatus TaxID=28038 RepID=A0A0B2XD48_LATCU|nr:MerR family transcriptional regulator [Latilactobacillus curvatus]ANJ69679.1 MerR family transcriptional regulator [Latilactobacillus curvatus]AWV72652.1 MerR family transcriptional regulator [Latilactobacillus curvatus]EHE86695.1 HTH-type transcriptional regulator glnR [Latilactobacillus curvatus CRL 705]KHO12893.1 HTH-type transcriptional regulator glnR [Latilactobacillus curvatus]KRK93330.1 HTH-type transcriptional regulator glnR [Latilactobacillus curvatus JCM 1096 = DSM 20019]